MDDLPDFVNTKPIVYADDITLLYFDCPSINSDFYSDIDVFCAWTKKKQLIINVEKSKCMTLSRNISNCKTMDIVINNSTIEQIDCIKILGVYFTSDLRWDVQFAKLYAKCCRSMSFVRRLRNNNNRGEVVWQAFVSLVLCHITFCWSIICDVSVKNFQKLDRLYRLAIRWSNVQGKPHLRDFLDKMCIKLIKKISGNPHIHPLVEFFTVRDPARVVRRSRKLLSQRRSSSLYNGSFVKYSRFT